MNILKLMALGIFSVMLLLLAIIDYRRQRLPDVLTLPLLWLGLLANTQTLFVPLDQAVWGAIIGYCSLYLIAALFYRITGQIGMGGGDLKLFAALGAWCGWSALPGIMAAASLTALLPACWMLFIQKKDLRNRMAFGPFLAFYGWIALCFFT